MLLNSTHSQHRQNAENLQEIRRNKGIKARLLLKKPRCFCVGMAEQEVGLDESGQQATHFPFSQKQRGFFVFITKTLSELNSELGMQAQTDLIELCKMHDYIKYWI